jgi:hypothetical protein
MRRCKGKHDLLSPCLLRAFLNYTNEVNYLSQCPRVSNACVCGRLLAGIAGSNLAAGMDVCLWLVLSVVIGLCDGLITRPEEFY